LSLAAGARRPSVRADGHIGHGAVLQFCRIGKNALIGMNAVIMDGAEIGEECIVAAMTFVRANTKVPPRSLVAGVPARILREVTADEIAWKSEGTATYQALAIRSARTMQAVEPLTAPEPGRKRLDLPRFEPLYAVREWFER
jgi:phenylacetic acid degradation protein